MLKIAQLGNITKAAASLGYSQSALSNIVASLESEWNLRLLIREKYGVRLTREGELLLPTLQTIVEENDRLHQQISQLHTLDKGTIRLGAFMSAYNHLLPPLIKSFTQLHPNIQFEFRQAGYRELAKLVQEGSLDCGFLGLPTSPQLKTIPLYQDEVLAVFPDGTPAEPERFPIENIQSETVIVQKEMEAGVLDLLKKHKVELNIKFFSDSEYTMLPMVASGLGMCILPELMLRGTPHKLVQKPLEPPIFRSIALAYREEQLTPATRQFIRHVTDHAPLTLPKP